MRFLSFSRKGAKSWGIAVADGVVDLGARLGPKMADLRSYIAAGLPDARAHARFLPDHPFDEIVFEPVIPNPSKILMVALNYEEGGTGAHQRPDYPVLFLRLPATQIGHGTPLVKPRVSDRLDFEGELAVVIGRGGRYIPRESAVSHVAGYSCYNDGSVRDWQRHSHQFTPGKNFAGTGAFGPWMVTADELTLPPHGLSLVTRVNGVEKQRTDTSRMIFDVAYLVSYTLLHLDLYPPCAGRRHRDRHLYRLRLDPQPSGIPFRRRHCGRRD